MQWEEILTTFDLQKTEFLRIHKCINQNRPIGSDTLTGHVDAILKTYEKIGDLIIRFHKILKSEQVLHLKNEHSKLRDRLIRSFQKHSIKLKIPIGIYNKIDRTKTISDTEESDSETDSEKFSDTKTDNMALSAVEFLNLVERKWSPNMTGNHLNCKVSLML